MWGMTEMTRVQVQGFDLYPGYLSPGDQARMVADIRAIVAAAPLFHPVTPRGQKMSVRMTSAGRVGWVSDRRGYRYDPRHPSGGDWPPLPGALLDLWRAHARASVPPDTALINYYAAGARMGLHQDRDEADLSHPVLSLSLGDDALFRIGTATKGGPTVSHWLHSGDVVVLEGRARLAYHGIDRLRPGTSSLLAQGGRINVTMRVAGNPV